MATVVVRHLDEEILFALKRQAASRNRSMEEHVRRLLRDAVDFPRRQPLVNLLMGVPKGTAEWPQ